LLADPDDPEDVAEMERLGLSFIDLVCVDMYPLQEAGMKDDATLASIRNSTDIGGPTMLRSAAKGRRIVVASPKTRTRVLEWLHAGEPISAWFRNELAIEAESIVSSYCNLSSELLRWGARELNAAR
jgi:phosphoribosylaminoimidazolecarboxamide formyltransferase/IMP cyclohydrolase